MTDNYYGFYLRPLVWCSDLAHQTAASVPKSGTTQFARRKLTATERNVFRDRIASHTGRSFETLLTADGFLACRDPQWQKAVAAQDFTDLTNEIANATLAKVMREALQTLNIFQLAFDHGMHTGQNHQQFTARRLTQFDVGLVRCDRHGKLIAHHTFNDGRHHAAQSRTALSRSVTLDRQNCSRPAAHAFGHACALLEFLRASEPRWTFASRAALSWAEHRSRNWDGSFMAAWAIVERELQRRLRLLLARNPGPLLNPANKQPMKAKAERRLRAQNAAGGSPTAGAMCEILSANRGSAPRGVRGLIDRRNAILHDGDLVTEQDSVTAHQMIKQLARSRWRVELNYSVHAERVSLA